MELLATFPTFFGSGQHKFSSLLYYLLSGKRALNFILSAKMETSARHFRENPQPYFIAYWLLFTTHYHYRADGLVTDLLICIVEDFHRHCNVYDCTYGIHSIKNPFIERADEEAHQ